MKIKRGDYFLVETGATSSIGSWFSADLRWLFNRNAAGKWVIYATQSNGTMDAARRDLLCSLGLDGPFKTRRDAVKALSLALEGASA